MIIEDNYNKFKNSNIYYLINNSNKRKKNKIRITKNKNPNIFEYNLDLFDENEDNDEYLKDFNIENKYNKNKVYNNNKNQEYNFNIQKQKCLQHYYNYFTKDIRPSNNIQFNICGKVSKTKLLEKKYFLNIDDSYNERNKIKNYENNLNKHNKLIKSSNFIETDKTIKANIINTQRNKLNKKFIIDNIDNDNSSSYKILVKKRPKNEIIKTGNSKQKRVNSTSLILLNKENNKKNEKNLYEICKVQNFILINNKNYNHNKLYFNNDNELIDYINSKYEEERNKKILLNKNLKYTGFVLTKKYKGKNLYNITIEDEIDKINKQLKDEKVLVNNKMVELIFSDKNLSSIYYNNILDQNKKLKLENEKLINKENFNKELIQKLNKEKQILIEKITKLSNKIEELNNNKFIQEKINQNGITNKNILFKIEKSAFFSINKEIKIKEENGQDIVKNNNDKIREDNINIFYKNNENKNNIIINKEIINNLETKNNFNNEYINNKENISILNNNKNDFINTNYKEKKIKIYENYNNMNSEENKFFIGNFLINDELEGNIFIQNQNHPKINDLVEEGMSDEELN